jgi:hypothetical protein
MGWVESPPYFCAASETAQDVTVDYIETKLGSLPHHKFNEWAGASWAPLNDAAIHEGLQYVVEVYVNNFIAAIIPTTREQVDHIAQSILHGIHNVFPASRDNNTDPISAKKLCKGDGTFDTKKCILGFEFDGRAKLIWLEVEKRAALLTILHHWIRGATKSTRGVSFAEFKLVMVKLHHAFTALPEAQGLLSPCNWIIQQRPIVVFLHQNGELLEAINDIQTILRESIKRPTLCTDLMVGWPDYIGIVDASSHGVGGVVLRELSGIPPTVFCLEWPKDIKDNLVSFDNPGKSITNSDLEMVGLLFLWLCVEAIVQDIAHKHVALFTDNSPTVSWVEKMASKKSRIAAKLVCALALRLNITKTCPLTWVHIPGMENSLTDIPSRSFGSVKEWACNNDNYFLTLFNRTFPLPNQALWTTFCFTTKMTIHVISVLRMKGTTLDKWQQLPKIGQHTGDIGQTMSGLWDWTLIYRGLGTRRTCASSLDSPPASTEGPMGKGSTSRLERLLALSWLLDRRLCWPVEKIQQR